MVLLAGASPAESASYRGLILLERHFVFCGGHCPIPAFFGGVVGYARDEKATKPLRILEPTEHHVERLILQIPAFSRKIPVLGPIREESVCTHEALVPAKRSAFSPPRSRGREGFAL